LTADKKKLGTQNGRQPGSCPLLKRSTTPFITAAAVKSSPSKVERRRQALG